MLALLFSGCTPPGQKAINLGENLLKQGRYSQAINVLEKAIHDLPENASAWNDLGVAYQACGHRRDAFRSFQRALMFDRNLAATRYNLGCLQFEQGNLPSAIVELTTFVELKPRSVKGWLKLGRAQLRAGELSKAAESFENCLRYDPQQVAALNELGIVAWRQERYRDAYDFFTAALKKRPDYSPALLNKAILSQEHFRNYRVALESYLQYLAFNAHDPRAPEIKKIVSRIEQAISRPVPAHSSSLISRRPPKKAAKVSPPAQKRPAPPAKPPPSAAQPKTPVASAVQPKSPVASAKGPAPLPKTKAPPAKPVKEKAAPSKTPARLADQKQSPPASPTVQSNAPPVVPEKPLEVVKLSPEPRVRAANPIDSQGIVVAPDRAASAPPSSIVQATPPASRTNAVAATHLSRLPPEASVGPQPPPPQKGKKRGLFSRLLHPFQWFHSKDKKEKLKPTPLPDQPSTSDAALAQTLFVATNRPAMPARAPDRQVAAPKPKRPPLIRFHYQLPQPPQAGDRQKAEPFFRKGYKEQEQSHWKEALEAYRKAIQSDPAYFAAYFNEGLAAYELGRLSKSLSAYEYALALKPGDAKARYNFALALEKSGYYQDAADELERVLAAEPNNAGIHFALANLYAERLDLPELARKHYLKVIQINPEYPQATAIRYWLADH